MPTILLRRHRLTHLPEQKETHHLIQMLRHESNTGQLDDLSHIASEYCLADPLTKSSAKPDQLVKTIENWCHGKCRCASAFSFIAQTQGILESMGGRSHA